MSVRPTPPNREFEDHTYAIRAVAVFPDRRRMVTASFDKTLRLWDLRTGGVLRKMEGHRSEVLALAVSRDGQLIASGDNNGEVIAWHGETGEPLTAQPVQAHSSWINSLDLSPDGTALASGTSEGTMKLWSTTTGDIVDPTIREWDTSTWQQAGDAWRGHDTTVFAIAIHPAGILVASAAYDHCIRLWRLSDQRTIAIFRHSSSVRCVTFSIDGKHILSGGEDKKISEWAIPEGALQEGSEILAMNTTVRNVCIAGDLSTAEGLLTQDISIDANNYTLYASRSFVMARKHHWDHALQDAITSVSIRPSSTGYISKGIALFGKGHVRDAIEAFDLASRFTDEDSKRFHFILLIKAIAMFNADQREEAILRVRELAATCHNDDTLPCRIVEVYLLVRLGMNAMDDAHHNEAADHFTAAVNSSDFSSTLAIHSTYEDLVVLFGWDLKSLWKTARQKQCDALLRAGIFEGALKSYQDMMDMSDENTKASCLDWSNAFKEECSALYLANGDAALAARDYDRAIDLYSVVINLNSASETTFANRSRANSEKMLWEDALLDAQKVIELSPWSHVGYQLKHAALRGAQHYDEAIDVFKIMLSNLDDASEAQIRRLRQQYVSPSEAEDAIRGAVWIELEDSPLRLLHTSTGLLCDRVAQLNTFKLSTEYKELLSFTTNYADLRTERIKEVVVKYFRCVLLSHRWEETESLLHDIQDEAVYELNALGGIVKLQSFCKTARDAGYYWAWMDTCCINKNNNAEVQESINSMFIWYRHSALTIVYLSDVPPSSRSGALARSAWNKRRWTFQEFVAPKVVLFYRKDWTLYLDDDSPNHKECPAIMEELEGATGIDVRALISFRPGMRGAREKLQWASTRVTTVQEDIAYSLFGIFSVNLPVIYGERKQNALGRLLQEIVARSGDITALDWVGQSSEFNSCLPADISSYTAPPCAPSSLSEDEIHTAVSLLQDTVAVGLASKLYTLLDNISAPRFANCRLHLPCIAFRVTEVRRRGPAQQIPFTYGVKVDGLQDLLITTEETLVPFSRARPTPRTFLLVRPWDRYLLELPDFAEPSDFGDDTESEDDYWSAPESPLDDSPGGPPVEQELVDSEFHSRALRLIVRLGQPFGAFLLAQQRGGEYKRIASDYDIIAQVEDVASVDSMMDVRTVEIL